MDIPHIGNLFTSDRHFKCFQFGTIMNDAARNMCVQVLCGHMFSFLLGRYLVVGCLGHIVGVCLPFEVTAKLFSKVSYSLQQQMRFPGVYKLATRIRLCL